MSSSIIDIIQGQIPRPPGIELATVVQADPLVIRLDNDKIMLRAEDGDLLACEQLLEHTRSYTTDTVTRQTITLHYKLQAGDRVVVMALPGGQQYLIWDKVVVL